MRRAYFETTRRALSACLRVEDAEIVLGAGPVLATLDVLERRAPFDDAVPVDPRPTSGLPTYDAVANVVVDHDRLNSEAGTMDLATHRTRRADLVEKALDEILLDRRRPSPVIARELAKVGYIGALAGADRLHSAFVSGLDHVGSDKSDLDGNVEFTWSFWDAVASLPVRVFASFEREPDNDEFVDALFAVAKSFDDLSTPLVNLSAALDRALPEAGVVRVTRVVYGALHGPGHMNGGETSHLKAMASSGLPLEDMWAFEVRKEVSNWSGTSTPGGILRRSMRIFDVDATDEACVKAGATSIVRRLLLPYALCQRLLEDPLAKDLLATRRIQPVHADGTLAR